MRNKILVIEDDIFYLDQLKYMLINMNYDVLATANPEEGIDQLEKYSPDVLLLDWIMPNITGLEVIKIIREKIHDQNLYIIMLSGNIYTNDIVDSLTMGANDYIIKPFSEEELLARIHNGVRCRRLQKCDASKIKKVLGDLKKLDAVFQQIPSLIMDADRTTIVMNEGKQLLTSIRSSLLIENYKN